VARSLRIILGAVETLALDPDAAIARQITAVGSLGNDAFEAVTARTL
jgi:hypothetical protein